MTYLILIGVFIAAFIAYYGRNKDITSSEDFIYYGNYEGNSFQKDEFGYFKATANKIGSYGLIAALVLIALIWTSSAPFAIGGLLLFGIPSIIMGINNVKKNKHIRETIQIPVLRYIADHDEVPQATGNLSGGLSPFDGFPVGSPKRYFYRTFGWVYSTNPDAVQAKQEVDARLIEIAHKPETEWFPK